MDHYVAYHSVDLMGQDYSPEDRFEYRSRKPETLLRATLGTLVWLIVGTKSGRTTEYRLAGMYTPDSLRESDDAWVIEGWGSPLRPPPILNNRPWFSAFLRSQGNFSLGFNRLSEPDVIAALSTHLSLPDASSDTTSAPDRPDGSFDPAGLVDARRWVRASVVRRQGQGEFRSALLGAYGSRCAISGCPVEDVLDAAHIVPYCGELTNHVQNGLLLRTDLHTLFDLGLIAVDPSAIAIIVSPKLAGTEYATFDGTPLSVPEKVVQRPSMAALEHHRTRAGLTGRCS